MASAMVQFVVRTLISLLGHRIFANRKVIAPILRPAAFVVIGAERQLLAVADRRHPAGVDSERLQVVLAGLCALGAQRDIVFLRSAFIAKALDLDLGIRMRLEPARVGFEHWAVLILDRVIVVSEMNVAERTAFADGPVYPVLLGLTAGPAR